MLDKNAIASLKDHEVGEVKVPMWGGSVKLRSHNLKESDFLAGLLRKSFSTDGDKVTAIKSEESEEAYRKYRLFSVGFSICDDKEERLFTDEEIETILGKKSPESINYLFERLGEVVGKKHLPKKESSDLD